MGANTPGKKPPLPPGQPLRTAHQRRVEPHSSAWSETEPLPPVTCRELPSWIEHAQGFIGLKMRLFASHEIALPPRNAPPREHRARNSTRAREFHRSRV